MTSVTHRQAGESGAHHLPLGPVAAIAFLVLGIAAAALVLVVIPRAFGIESSCLSASGTTRVVGDSYVAGLVLGGTLGWLAVFLGMIFANISERRDIAVLLPVVWFVAFVLGALVLAVVIGPAPCPA